MNQKPVDDKELDNILLNLRIGTWQSVAIKQAKATLNAHYQKKYLGLLDDAIIFSAKHVGLWDEKMSDDVRKGRITKLYLDLPSLRVAIANIGKDGGDV